MQLTLRHNLPCVRLIVSYQGQEIEIPDVVVDTGSAATVIAADTASQIGIIPRPDDVLHVVRGVGGTEIVYTRKVDRLQVGSRAVRKFEVEVAGLDYGFDVCGILGTEFLSRMGAVIYLGALAICFAAD